MKLLSYNEGDSFVVRELSIINQLISDAKMELDYYKENKVLSYGIQASEKLWGTLAHMIRLNQYLLGYKIPKSHRDNIIFMKNMVSEKDLQEMRKRAGKMHKRFYTGSFSYEDLIADYKYVLRKKRELFGKIRKR